MEEIAHHQFVELEEKHFWFIGRRRIFFHLLDRELAGRGDLKLLDVGCGAGGMLEPLSRYGEVSGLDVSEEAVAFCRSRGFERVVVGSGYDLPVAPGSLDVVTLFDTIEHIPDDARVLAQCHEALAPGGLVFLSVPAYSFLYAENDRLAHHERRYTAREIRRKLMAAGLTPTKVTYFNTFLFPAILPAVLAKKAKERRTEPTGHTNLSHEMRPLVNSVLAATMGAERHLLTRMSFPFGHSIVGMARKRL